MELEASWGRTTRVWWAHYWRNLLIGLAGAVVAGFVGFVIGVAAGAMGIDSAALILVTIPIGMLIGMAVSVIPMKLILGKDFGEFRLVLLSKEESVLSKPSGDAPIAAAAPSAGWFSDPSGGHRLRWWDGAGWTEHTHD
jgi:hypothetical protein